MSDSHHRRRTALGYWVPLFLTVTIATAGVATWVLSSRSDDESSSSDDADLSYGEEHDPSKPLRPSDPRYRDERQHTQYTGGEASSHGVTGEKDESFVAQMRGAIRRTPSPQQVFDMAGKRVAAGVAAAGAMVGGALGSIREEGRDDYADHSRWNEEALRRNTTATSAESNAAVAANTGAFVASVRDGPGGAPGKGIKRKVIAVVVSADAGSEYERGAPGEYHMEHASILSHLPHPDAARTDLLILIYNPSRPSSGSTGGPPSLGSSYSAISTPAQTPGEELSHIDPRPDSRQHTPAMSAVDASASSIYTDVYNQARRLVERSENILPFTTKDGHIHILRHLTPDIVYIPESLSGVEGGLVRDVEKWVGQVIVVVGGGGGELGGLVDTDDEDQTGVVEGKDKKWWQSSDLVGLGKGVEVVDAGRVGDDFGRRAGGRD